MAEKPLVRLGFVGNSAPSSPHHRSFKALIPKDIDLLFVQEVNPSASLWDAEGKLDALISQVSKLIEEHRWDGVIISGAPKEVLNPGMWDRVTSALKIPVALALRSSAVALTVYSVKRILLMTPVDDALKKLYGDYLARFGIEAAYQTQTLRAHTDAQKLASSDVEAMTQKAFAEQSKIDAIYFQGALLDPIPVLERLEQQLDIPIIASNPAMLWFLLSKLGFEYKIAGYGKLLSSWPALPAP
jgi:hypothetical protein